MKRKVRISETQLNTIIKKALKEQQEDQFMTGTEGDQDKMAGGPEDEAGAEGGESDYTAFMSAAQELMGQGITIGNLVDKLCEVNNAEEEPEEEPEQDTETEPSIPASPMAESRKKR